MRQVCGQGDTQDCPAGTRAQAPALHPTPLPVGPALLPFAVRPPPPPTRSAIVDATHVQGFGGTRTSKGPVRKAAPRYGVMRPKSSSEKRTRSLLQRPQSTCAPVQAEAQGPGHSRLFLKRPPQVTTGEGDVDTNTVTTQ